ncbi:MAG TPA: YggS family pyridoxal phosphate-dependent enzyme [Candidatus Omnitrophota bacterium]|nr:YggS family pyridoxal phosphate-dependent enzyme [Candidatus Omnitrophota bacterium]HPD84028.1 YggS family pyridoxal phosphate-dependent enzyme [Candidatus Omnitrophota bacterium]HRZ02885.1 YggS family pyridoxal phosphate-dependent enzyme [Candidatus Omnitrophota bacterium]
MIKDNITHLKSNISLICERLGKDPGEVTVVGVTKFAPVSAIEEALACGISDVGENRVQEAVKKYSAFKNPGKIKRHMIGHLQTNKVKDALEIFDVIQSVDSLKLAESVERVAAGLKRQVDIFIQVNISGEQQKFGIGEQEAMALIRESSKFEHLKVRGLMTIAPLTEDEQIIRSCFRGLRQLRDKVNNELPGRNNVEMKFLSMGMTSDYQIALEEGANMLRIGRGIFSDV